MKYVPSLILRVIMCFIPISAFNFVLMPITIYSSYFILWFFGATLAFNQISLGPYSFEFIDACVAPAAFYLLWVLVMLVKDIKFKIRVKMVLLGFLLLLGMNVLRVAVLVLTANYLGFNLFEAVHLIWWKFMSGVYLAAIWIFLVWYYKIKSIPVYDDLRYLFRFTKKKKELKKSLFC